MINIVSIFSQLRAASGSGGGGTGDIPNLQAVTTMGNGTTLPLIAAEAPTDSAMPTLGQAKRMFIRNALVSIENQNIDLPPFSGSTTSEAVKSITAGTYILIQFEIEGVGHSTTSFTVNEIDIQNGNANISLKIPDPQGGDINVDFGLNFTDGQIFANAENPDIGMNYQVNVVTFRFEITVKVYDDPQLGAVNVTDFLEAPIVRAGGVELEGDQYGGLVLRGKTGGYIQLYLYPNSRPVISGDLEIQSSLYSRVFKTINQDAAGINIFPTSFGNIRVTPASTATSIAYNFSSQTSDPGYRHADAAFTVNNANLSNALTVSFSANVIADFDLPVVIPPGGKAVMNYAWIAQKWLLRNLVVLTSSGTVQPLEKVSILKLNRTGLSQNITDGTSFNLTTLFTAANVVDVLGQPIGSYVFTGTSIRLPALTHFVDYTFVASLTGTIGGTATTLRQFPLELRRASDNSLIRSSFYMKANANTLTSECVNLESYSINDLDNFVTSGIRLVINNNSTQTITLTGVEVVIKGRR